MAGHQECMKIYIVVMLIRCIKIFFAVPGGTCKFSPTCGTYAQTALREHTFSKAVLIIMWRLLRCNPFSFGGYDPVPTLKQGNKSE